MKTLVSGFIIIFIALALSLSMPCYAQVETQRFFTPEGTVWKINTYHYVVPDITEIGFFEGIVYFCDNDNNCQKFGYYKNRLISKFDCIFYFDNFSGMYAHGYVIPFLRYGKMTFCVSAFPRTVCVESTLTKIDDNFSPEP